MSIRTQKKSTRWSSSGFRTSASARRIHTGIGGDRFDAVITAHPHLICTRCGGVFDLQCDIDRETELLRQTFERAGAQVDEVQIRAWGTCDRCKEEGTL